MYTIGFSINEDYTQHFKIVSECTFKTDSEELIYSLQMIISVMFHKWSALILQLTVL